MINLSNTLTWKKNLGLLPIKLKPISDSSNFVMLNGGHGDFCLQILKDESSIEDYYSKSWSSNTKNFVVLDSDKVKIFNWARDKPEEIPQSLVNNNFNTFYNYLLSKSFKSERDVVPFIIDIFRHIRNITLEKTNPVEALNLLFILLTSLENDISELDHGKWNINAIDIPNGFEYLTEMIQNGINNIKPELDLIIRHSAGVLFQEAQKEVLFFNPQLDLFGGISGKLTTTHNLYSSIHYTPPFLSRTIVENSLKLIDLEKENIKIFDPACGSSEFLIEALKQLKELGYNGFISVLGWDSSETAINTSNFLLKYEQRTIWGEKLNFEFKLVRDSLIENWDDDNDLILMNPPFVSWELLKDKNLREGLRDVLGSNFEGKPNQASGFFYKSIQNLKEDGVIGCVLPSSLLNLDSYKKLRNDVYDSISINLLCKLGNFVFEDALTDVSLIIGHKPKTSPPPTIIWTKNEKGIAQEALRGFRKMVHSNELTINEQNYSIYQPMIFPMIKENWKPISLKENELFKTIERFVVEKKLIRVGELFSVKQGIRQGAKNIFKITAVEYADIPDSEKKYFRAVIDNNAIQNGKLITENFIWYPYGKNGLLLRSIEDLNTKATTFYSNVLEPNKDVLAKRSWINENEWWALTRPRNWQFEEKPKLVSSEFGNSDSFAFDRTGAFVVERGNAWIPKKIFEEIDNYYFYLAVFSSSFFDELLSIYSKQLAGGQWYDLGKLHTKHIPIPNVHAPEVRASEGYAKLVEIGKELYKGNLYLKPVSDEILTKLFYPKS